MGVQATLAAVARKRIAGGGGFVPTDIAGCKLWLDASQIVGLSDGDPVSTWADASGDGNDATGSGGARPTYQTNELNSLPVVRFDATNDRLTVSSFSSLFSTAGSMFAVVMTHQGLTGAASWFCTGGGASHADKYNATSYLTTFQNSGRVDAYDSPPQDTFIVVSLVASSTFTRYIDGVIGGGGSPSITFGFQQSDLYIGENGAFPLDGDIAEMIAYDSALGTTDRQTVEAYLATKYGL